MIYRFLCGFICVSPFPRVSQLNQQICISPKPGNSLKLTHTGGVIDTCAFQTGCQLSSAASGMSLGLGFVTQLQWHEANVLGNWQLAVFPIYVRKYRQYTIDRRIMVYTVCASAMISLLRQWLDSYAKTRLKMLHTFKHFIQYFLLLSNLVIVFVIVSTGVLCEPRQCSLFGDYIPESKLCFCLNLCRSPGAYSIRPIQKLFNCQTTTRN